MVATFLKRLLREPLFHFLLIGACLFILSGLRTGRKPVQFGQAGAESARIVVTPADVDSLIGMFTSLWRRPPTAEELKGLVDARVREEVYYREALKLGLDRDDTIVRGRLQEKLEFISRDVNKLREPSEQELSDFLAQHSGDFSAAGRVPALNEIRPAVVKAWTAAQRREEDEKFYRNLLKNYTVTIELPPELPGNGRAPAGSGASTK
jgi:hypothetical protein